MANICINRTGNSARQAPFLLLSEPEFTEFSGLSEFFNSQLATKSAFTIVNGTCKDKDRKILSEPRFSEFWDLQDFNSQLSILNSQLS